MGYSIFTKVRCPGGDKEIGELSAGDYVLNENDEPVLVLEVGPIVKQTVYMMKFLDFTSPRSGIHRRDIEIEATPKQKVSLVITGCGAHCAMGQKDRSHERIRTQWYTKCVDAGAEGDIEDELDILIADNRQTQTTGAWFVAVCQRS